MQHINHNVTRLPNVHICGLISKHPYINNSKILYHMYTSITELHEQTLHTHLTGHAGYQHASLWGVLSLLVSLSHGRCM